ncbi:MAG: CBS domain-containing protein [Deltaproteobacteria bacterium]|nr:CBS domain-containing protein [Deltaproteobacteria bacterium]
MEVRDIMTANPLSARLQTSVFDAIRTLESEQIRHLPIVEGGELVGIVSDRDLLRFSHAALLEDPDAARTRLQVAISTIMTSDPSCVAPEDDVDDAIDLMLENRIGALPVVDEAEGRLVGILSYVDVMRAARGKL